MSKLCLEMPRPWITSLELEEVRTFQAHRLVKLDRRLTVFAGVNNAGKSTILFAILAAAQRAAGTGIPNEPQRGGVRPATFKVHFAFDADELASAEPDLAAKCIEYFEVHQPSDVRLAVGLSPGHAGVEIVYNNEYLRLEQGTLRGVVRDGAAVQIHQAVRSLPGAWALGLAAAKAVGFWKHDPTPDARDGAAYRLLTNDTDQVGARLTALRLNHPTAFQHLETALALAFPELERIHFRPSSGTYHPTLKLKSSHLADGAVTREVFGAGVWTFLCVLLACRLAHETGAGTMVLDEPTVFMHASLERLLLKELTDPSKWGGAPMQLVIATHSPVFVEEALREGILQVVEWVDRSAAVTGVTAIEPIEEAGAHVRRSADFLYARTVLFVEGKSDEAALWELRRLVNVPCYVMALGIKDWYLKEAPRPELRRTNRERLSTLAPLAHVRGGGPARIMLDEDAREVATKLVDKVGVLEVEQTVYVGGANLDFEGLFCEREFLADFFRADSGEDAAGLLVKIDTVLAEEGKGCDKLYRLFIALRGDAADKQTILAEVARHYASRPAAFQSVSVNLQPVLQVYEAGEA